MTSALDRHSDVEQDVVSIMMTLGNVEALIAECPATEAQKRLDLYRCREELVMQIAALGAEDMVVRAYGWVTE